jgi:hypothetical protein
MRVGEVNIDGKAILGSGGKGRSAAQIVSARGGARYQIKTEEKSNESTAIPQLVEIAGDTGYLETQWAVRKS